MYMKCVNLYIAIFFIIYGNFSYGQRLVNGDFAFYCGTQSGGNCSTFENNCILNWQKSHGTPQLIAAIPSFLNQIFMWATTPDYSRGEGIFASYNFTSGNVYTIKVRAAAGNSVPGELRLVAANGMTGSTTYGGDCGSIIPTVSGSHTITSTNLTQSFVTYTWSWTPGSNYSQIWIYPYYFSSEQFDMYVDFVSIYPDSCAGTVIYNSGAVDYGTVRGAYIYAGSTAGTGGSGTVTIANNQTTSLYAINDIYLLPEFQATLSSGEFSAQIVSCNAQIRLKSGENNALENDLDRPVRPVKFGLEERAGKQPLEQQNETGIFPNPVRDILTVRWNDLSRSAISVIRIYNELGVLVNQVRPAVFSSGNTIRINVSDLPPGLFILTISADKQSFTHKFNKIR